MLHQLETPTTTTTSTAASHQDPDYSDHTTTFHDIYSDEFDTDSNCSTPYVSAPSSPSRYATPAGGFYYSAPASPVHYIFSSSPARKNSSISPHSETSPASSTCSFEFDFSATLSTSNGIASPGSLMTMTSADELFLNGQIRPVLNISDEVDNDRGRASKYRDRSRRRTRSMSPLRTTPFQWKEDLEESIVDEKEIIEKKKKGDGNEDNESEGLVSTTTTPIRTESASSSRSSSIGRSSKRWVSLKEFLYRSKSEGRNTGNKFWGSLSFSPVKDKIKMEKFLASKITSTVSSSKESVLEAKKVKQSGVGKEVKKKAVNGVSRKSRVPSPSPHELHYTANRAQAEEMRKKTFLPYRQGLFGCLGLSSKSYHGAMNGFARTLNPVSSR